MNSKHLLLVAAASALLGNSPAIAQTDWTPTSSNGWGTSANWDNGIPNASGAIANVGATATSTNLVDLGGNTYTIGTLNLGSSSPTDTNTYNLQNGVLNFNNGGAGAVLNDSLYANGDTINNVVLNLQDDLTISDNQVNTNGTPYGLEIGYGISGGGDSITGTGDLTVENNAPNGVNIRGYGGFPIAFYNSVNNTGEIINEGTGTGNTYYFDAIGSNVTEFIQNTYMNSSSTRQNTAAASVVAGFKGTTNIDVQSGMLYFNGAANGGSYTSMSQVTVGDTAYASLPPGDLAATNQAPAVLDFGGIGTWQTGSKQTISGFGTIQANNGTFQTVAGTTIAPGVTGHIGRLSFGSSPNFDYGITTNVTLAAGTNLSIILGSSGNNSSIGITGTLDLPALKMDLGLIDNAGADGLGSLGVGTYDLIDYGGLTGASAGDITSLFDITAPAGYTYDLTDTGTGAGQIDLTVTEGGAVPEPGTWALLLGGLGLLAGARQFRRTGVSNL